MSSYYKTLSQTIMQKLNDIDKEDFVNFYDYNKKFEIATLISFFSLKEDEIISINKSNPDINTRYTLNIEQKELDDIFKLQNPISIDSKEPGGNRIWLLSAIRNSLLHDSSCRIDFENRSYSSVRNNCYNVTFM